MSTHRLLHWNAPNRTEFLDLDVQELETQVKIDVLNDGDPDEEDLRAVSIEVRDNGALAVLCYPRDRDEPISVILNADGTYEVSDE